MIRSGKYAVEDVTGFAVFFEEEAFKSALRPFLKGTNGIETEDYAHKMAKQLITVAKYQLGYSAAQLLPFEKIAARLKPKKQGGMGDRNRKRLEQFDDEETVMRLLRFPEEELARALRLKNSYRRAKGVERSLAISLMIFTSLRVKNLREFALDQNIRRVGDRVFVYIPEGQAKTHKALELELPPETIRLFELFVREFRAGLPVADGPFLFPGADGGPRSYSAMRDALGRALWKHGGIRISPHLYRYAIAKIIVERNPELALDVSRRLGHSSINTTYQSYLGTEGPAASRRINRLLTDLVDPSGKGGT